MNNYQYWATKKMQPAVKASNKKRVNKVLSN